MEDIKKKIRDLVASSQKIVIVQADNPDGDSLSSAIALEQILHDMGKEPQLYCGVDIPSYLSYIPGRDRVEKDLPNDFDLSILVDCSTITLLEQLEKTNQMGMIGARPMIVLDHHDSQLNLPLENIPLVQKDSVATGEVIYYLAKELGWSLNKTAMECLASSLLSDSLGLTSEGTTAKSVYMLAELVENGVSLANLDERRRSTMLKPKSIVTYKGALLQRIEYFLDDQLAMVVIPWDEIEKYSPLYNPSMLALEELRMTENIKVSIALKTYPDGKITGKIRCSNNSISADELAGLFGGGGHKYAAGFKTNDWTLEELKSELISKTQSLIA